MKLPVGLAHGFHLSSLAMVPRIIAFGGANLPAKIVKCHAFLHIKHPKLGLQPFCTLPCLKVIFVLEAFFWVYYIIGILPLSADLCVGIGMSRHPKTKITMFLK